MKVGCYYDNILLQLIDDTGANSRNKIRVMPLEFFPNDMRVEFPRVLRNRFPIGTKFRARVKVAQKKDPRYDTPSKPYLIANPSSIKIEN